MRLVRRLAREPLVHFLLLGLAIVALRARFADQGSARRITVDAEVRRGLRQDHLRRTGSPPTPEEEAALIQHYVDDEVLYREALALGLDRGDVIVRRRLLQKMEFLADEIEPVREPSEAELQAYLDAHADRFAIEPRVALTQVFVSSDRHGAASAEVARELRDKLLAGADPAALGDPFPRGREIGPLTERELAGLFGPDFATSVRGLAVGTWSEPVRSTYGLHLVRVASRSAGAAPRQDDVRAAVREGLLDERRAAGRRAALDALRKRYEVEITD